MSAIDKFLAAVRTELGNAPEHLPPNEFVRFSTNARVNNRDGWAKLFSDCTGGAYGCMRQGIRRTWQAAKPRYLSPGAMLVLEAQRAQAARDSTTRQLQEWTIAGRRNAALWGECRPLSPSDLGSLYLSHRLRQVMHPSPDCLRFHPALNYWHDGKRLGAFPALVAALTSPQGDLLALHRTYLNAEGFKAPVPQVKKLTRAAGQLNGACIRLASPTLDGIIGVAEGVESAMAASLSSGLPVVAAYSAGAMASWRWPSSTRSIVIYGDNDNAGHTAAQRLTQRAIDAGLNAHVSVPSTPGLDWCDVWYAQSQASTQAEDVANG